MSSVNNLMSTSTTNLSISSCLKNYCKRNYICFFKIIQLLNVNCYSNFHPSFDWIFFQIGCLCKCSLGEKEVMLYYSNSNFTANLQPVPFIAYMNRFLNKGSTTTLFLDVISSSSTFSSSTCLFIG